MSGGFLKGVWKVSEECIEGSSNFKLRAGQVRKGQVRKGLVRKGQVKTGQVRTGQFRTFQSGQEN